MLHCLSTTITQSNMAYHQLTPQERYLISHLRKQGLCVAQIARQVGRHRSTISREFARNESRKGVYRPSKARRKPMDDALVLEEMDSLVRLITDSLIGISASNGARSKSRGG